MQSKTDNEDPNLEMPSKDSDEARRDKDLRERDEPR
jgi:hypothetical protein